jgi:hypothetical protein
VDWRREKDKAEQKAQLEENERAKIAGEEPQKITFRWIPPWALAVAGDDPELQADLQAADFDEANGLRREHPSDFLRGTGHRHGAEWEAAHLAGPGGAAPPDGTAQEGEAKQE